MRDYRSRTSTGRMPGNTARHAFTVIELLVVIGIIGILMAILLPMVEKTRHQGYIVKCASNLRQLGEAMTMYANANHGSFPRTLHVPGAPVTENTPTTNAGIDSFAAPPTGPAANDVTSAVFLLLRSQRIPPEVFICPYNDDTDYSADKAKDIFNNANFTSSEKNLAYSFANPYPDAPATLAGYQWAKLPADFAVAADKNPGKSGTNDDVTAPLPNSPTSIMKKANSSNHEKDGQNVLFGDGHVSWELTPFCGMQNDNIYTNHNQQIEASPVDKTDSVLLPTDD